jgi:hypothetical protein
MPLSTRTSHGSGGIWIKLAKLWEAAALQASNGVESAE